MYAESWTGGGRATSSQFRGRGGAATVQSLEAGDTRILFGTMNKERGTQKCANLKYNFKIAQIGEQKCGRNTQETREIKEANLKN